MTKVTCKGAAASAAILLIFCACFMVGVGLAAAAPSVSVSPQTNEYDAGETFQVSVLVNSDAANLRAVNLQLNYNPAVIQVNSITDNNLLGAGALVAPGSGYDNVAGTITYGIASTSGVYTPVAGTMLTINFQVKAGAADGMYNLDLNNVALKNQANANIAGVVVIDGTLKVGDAVIPVPDAPEVKISPAATGPVTAWNTFQVSVLVDSDTANLRAVNLQLNYDPAILQVNSITNNNLFGAATLVAPGSSDNGAGTISYGVAATGGTYSPVAGSMITINFQVKDTAASGLYALDLNNVVLKDQNNGAIAGVDVTDGTLVVEGSVAPTPDVPEVKVSPSIAGPVSIGDTFQIAVLVDSDTANLRAVNLQLNYDPAILQVNSITNNNLFGAATLVAPGSGDNGAGTISYGVAATGGAYSPVAGSMITINFQVKDTAANGLYALDLNNVVLKDQDNADIAGVDVTDGTLTVAIVPNIVPVPVITSHNDGDRVSGAQIVVAEDVSGQNDILSATFEYWADTNRNCIADEVGGVWTVFGTDNDGTDGWKAAVDTADLADGQYLIRAALDDGKDEAFTIVCITTYNPVGIILQPGWNLISFPETLMESDIDNVLRDFTDTEIDSVFYDNVATGSMDVPTDFEPLKAYWIHNNMSGTVVISEEYLTPKVPSTPPALRLYPGWNAVGHTAKVDLSAEISLATIDGSYVKIKGPWVPSAEDYAFVGHNGIEGIINSNHVGTDIFKMKVYEGYYVYVSEECVLA